MPKPGASNVWTRVVLFARCRYVFARRDIRVPYSGATFLQGKRLLQRREARRLQLLPKIEDAAGRAPVNDIIQHFSNENA